jgi:hypothetical protein
VGFGIAVLAHVRMKLARELSVRAFDLVLCGIAFDAHDFIVVLEIHTLLQGGVSFASLLQKTRR